jgi:hypothetical protein
LLVDHAEQSQSVIGVEHAEIVEVLDRHDSGSSDANVGARASHKGEIQPSRALGRRIGERH